MSSKNHQGCHIYVVSLVMAIFFVISFITNILNSIIVDVKTSFDLSLTSTGFLPFSFFIAYGVMSIPAGFLSEKYSNKKVLSTSFLVMTLASIGFIILPTYIVFILTLFSLGCCMAALQVIINPMLRVAGREEHFAFNSVLAQFVFGMASFISPFLYQYLVNENKTDGSVAMMLSNMVPEELSWGSLYIVFSVLSLCFFVLTLVIKYPSFHKNKEELVGSRKTYIELLKDKWTLLYFLGIFCYVGIEQGVGNWISQFLYKYHQLDPRTAGTDIVAYFWAMITMGCLSGLFIIRLIDSRTVLKISTALTIVCLLVCLFGKVGIILITFPLIGFFISVMWSIIFSLALNSIVENHGAVSGILCTGIAGGAIIPFIVGGIGQFLGLKMGMLFLILPLGFILSVGFWSKPIIKNKTISLRS